MTGESRHEACLRCGEVQPAESLDPFGWCADCRGEVIRRARPWARVAGLLVAGVFAVVIGFVLAPSPRFMVAWAALLVIVYFLTFKVAQRIAFDVIRARLSKE